MNRLVLSIVALTCLVAGRVLAQTSAGMIMGQVVDAQGGVVAGVDVILADEHTSVQTKGKTEPHGQFTFPSVQPGKYRVTVEAPGFKKLSKQNLTLSSSERLFEVVMIVQSFVVRKFTPPSG